MNTRFILLGLLSLLPLASQVSVFAEKAIEPDALGKPSVQQSTESLGLDSKTGSQDSSQGEIYKTEADLMNEFLGMDPSQVDEYVRRYVEACKKSPTFDWMEDRTRLESLKVTVKLAIEVKFGLRKAPSNDVLQKIIAIEAEDPEHEKEYKKYAAFANYYAALSILTEMKKSNLSIIEAANAVGTVLQKDLGLLQVDVDRLFGDAKLFLRAVTADKLMNMDANELLSKISRMPVTISYDSNYQQEALPKNSAASDMADDNAQDDAAGSLENANFQPDIPETNDAAQELIDTADTPTDPGDIASEPPLKKIKLDADSLTEESENDVQEIDNSMSVDLPSSDAEEDEAAVSDTQDSGDVFHSEIEGAEESTFIDHESSDTTQESIDSNEPVDDDIAETESPDVEAKDVDVTETGDTEQASGQSDKDVQEGGEVVVPLSEKTPTDTKQDLNRDDSVYPSGDDSAAKEDTEGLRQSVTGIKIEPAVDALAILGGSATSDESSVLMKKKLTEIRNRSMNGPKIETFKGSLESALNREYSKNGYKSRPCVINPTNGGDRSLYDCLPGLNDGLRSVAAGNPRHKFGLCSTLPLRDTFFPVNVLSHVSIDDPALLVYWTVAFAIMSESNVLIIDKQGWNLSGVNPDVFGTLLKKVLKDPTIVNLLDRIVLVNNENLTPSVQR